MSPSSDTLYFDFTSLPDAALAEMRDLLPPGRISNRLFVLVLELLKGNQHI